MVKSATRVCRILTLVGREKGGLRHAGIARALNIPSSSLSGLLASLVEQQFLSLNSETQKYLLGPHILTLAGRYLDGLDLVEHSRPVVQKLAEDSGESVSVSVRVEHEIIVVCKEDSSQLIKQTVQIGQRSPMHATASGKVILAHLSGHEVDQYLSSVELVALTPKTITDRKTFQRELEQVRSSGIAHNREELTDQIVAIAAPIFDLYGIVVASIVVSMPDIRFNDDKEILIERLVKEAARTISQKLGFKA